MKKLSNKLTALLVSANALAFSQSITNGTFESYNSLPSCPANSSTNTSITKCQTWNGLGSTYGSTCNYSDASGSSSGVEYYHSTGTSTCQPVSANGGSAYAYLNGNGFFGGTGTGRSEWIYQNVGTLNSGTTYLVSGYMHTQGTWLDLAAWIVPTSVGTSASQILNNLRGQSLPTAKTSTVNGWVQVNLKVTPSSTTTYYLVLGTTLVCNDGNNSNVGKMALDDFTLSVAPTCTVNAGADKTNHTACCPPGPCSGVTIGTAAVSGQTYTWSPTTNLSCINCAQPTASPCNTVSPTVYTVTTTGDACVTASDAVQVTTQQYSGPSCCRIGNISKKEITAFSVYPNPAKDRFTVTLYGVPEYVHIMDITGKLMYEARNVPESEIQIDVSKYPKGVYYVTAKIGDTIEKQAVVVE